MARIPLHMRKLALDTLGRGEVEDLISSHFEKYDWDGRPYIMMDFDLEDAICAWETDDIMDPSLSKTFDLLVDGVLSHNKHAEAAGAVMDGFDVVWPKFGARVKPTVGAVTLIIKSDGGNIAKEIMGDSTLVKSAQALAEYLAQHDPARVRDLISMAPALAERLRTHLKPQIESETWQCAHLRERYEEEVSRLKNLQVLYSIFQETE